MMNRRLGARIGLVSSASLLALGLAGCGASTAGQGGPRPGTVGIRFAAALTSKSQRAAMGHLVTEFEKTHPSVSVQLIPASNASDLYAKERAAIAAGNPPTLGQAEGDWAAVFARNKQIIPLTSYVNGKEGLTAAQAQGFWPNVWIDQFLPDGKQWMYPFEKTDYVLYYNAGLLKRTAGGVPSTWTDFASAARSAVSRTRDTWALSVAAGSPAAPQSGAYLWVALLRALGGHLLLNGTAVFDSPQGVQAMRYFKNLHDAGALKLGKGHPGQSAFVAGRTVFEFGPAASYPAMAAAVRGKFTLKAAAMPRGLAGQGNVMTGMNLVLFSKSSPAQKNASWQFMKWLAEPAQTAYWAEKTGYLPLSKPGAKLMKSYFAAHPEIKIAVASLPYARPFPATPGLSRALGAVGNAVDSVLLRGQPIQAALHRAAASAQGAVGGG